MKSLEDGIKDFWDNVNIGGPNDCWEHSSKSKDGYAGCAHRTSYSLTYGQIPKTNHEGRKIVVRHLCDNKRCVNPKHLALGTHSYNQLDRGYSKLSAKDVYIARRLKKDHRLTYEQIAKLLDVSSQTVRNAVLGKGAYEEV